MRPFRFGTQDDEASDTLPDIAQLDAKIAEAEEAMAKAETTAEKRKAKERKEDLMRLKRVEQIYVRQAIFLARGIAPLIRILPELCPTGALWLGPRFVEVTPGYGNRFGW